jgi:hypothetical protein
MLGSSEVQGFSVLFVRLNIFRDAPRFLGDRRKLPLALNIGSGDVRSLRH